MPDSSLPGARWVPIPVRSADPHARPHDSGERVVLGQRTPQAMVTFQWTGAEPEGLSETRFAESLGAIWEGDELVTYNLASLQHNYLHSPDGFLEDSD
ncbi:MAG: hypothetical protein NVSMB32_14420 [Actinomycetota bacterium]